MLNKLAVTGALVILIFGCGKSGPHPTNFTVYVPVPGPSGSPGPQGESGPQGEAGAAGASCTVIQEVDGAIIQCPDGSIAYVKDSRRCNKKSQ